MSNESPVTPTATNDSSVARTSPNGHGASSAVANGSNEKLVHRPGAAEPSSSVSDGRDLSGTDSLEKPPSRRGTRDSRTSGPVRQNTGGSRFGELKKRATWASLLHPSKRLKPGQPTYAQSVRRIITCTWLNVLLVFVPVSWALHFTTVSPVVVFVMSMLAIIPLAKLLGEGTEEIALRVGDTLGGLLNATLGNATELIVAILALVKCQITVVQSSLLGSILSNQLLVLGMVFFYGGIKFSEQSFSITAAQTNSSLLMIAVVAVLIPAGFHAAFGSLSDNVEGPDVLKMSRGIAIIILLTYGAYLIFQLWSHAHLYSGGDGATHDGFEVYHGHKIMRPAKSMAKSKPAAQPQTATDVEQPTQQADAEEEDEEEETPQMNTTSAIILLVIATILIGFTSEWLVDSLDGLTQSTPLTEAWVGLILLPIVGNAAEHVTAVTVAGKDKLDISMGVAVGSSIQIALFVIPLLVVLGWMMGRPLTLLFDPFESIALFLSVLIVNYTVADGKANWLEGWLLMMVYIIIAVAYFFYPADNVGSVNALGLVCTT